MRANKIAILHYQPLEYYPPITNLIEFLSEKEYADIRVYTTRNNHKRNEYINYRVKLYRYKLPEKKQILFLRLLNYVAFNLGVFINLVKFKPSKLLYYESYSAFPVYLYMLFFKPDLYIHFHEYFDKDWYKKGMPLVKIYHYLEKKSLFKKAHFISHTNAFRVSFFHRDFPYLDFSKLKIIPNYPPRKWNDSIVGSSIIGRNENKIKFIYVGSLSVIKTYICEFCEWVNLYPDHLTFDIFSYNYDSDVEGFFKENSFKNIRFFKEGVSYNDIPSLLKDYDIGLLLYKGTTLNYQYNSTNKLFEYLACNLDVWYPEELEGVHSYLRIDKAPKVIRYNFNLLHEISIHSISGKSNYTDFFNSDYYSEDAFKILEHELL